MEIKAIKFYKDGFMTQGFAFGGEEGKEKFDNNIKYRAGLTNYLIDTGEEIILVDTGMDVGTPEGQYNPNLAIYNGTKIADYIDAFKDLGYKPEQVTKILLTHKHPDHSGALKSFPNAKIYCSEEESETPVLKNIANIIKKPLYSEPSRCLNKTPNPKTIIPIKNNISDAIPNPFLYFFSFFIFPSLF